MNIINVKVNFEKGTCETTGINLITGDYNSTKMIFNFDRDTGTKVFEMKSPSEQLVMVQEIQNNEVILYGLDENENIASIFNEEGYYIFEISLYENESKLTSAKGKIKVKPEQVIIDGEVVEAYLPIFDQLLSQVNTAITQTNNLNITGSKVDTTSTITITHKDGTTTTLSVLDGEKGDKGDKGDAGAIKMLIVAELPATGADDTIYLVPLENPDVQGNNYAEYVYINGAWELLGKIGVQFDASNYVQFTDYATSNKGGTIKVGGAYGTGTAGGYLSCNYLTNEQYASLSNYGFVGKGTLENVITGKGLVSNTNYATSDTGGVIKSSSYYGYNINSNNGIMSASNLTYANYANASDLSFIGKGTLENVITGKGLTTKSYVDGLVGDIGTILDSINGESVGD